MSKAKMEAARELIREKQYPQARALLKTIDHPTARKWLDQLDGIAPEASDLPQAAPQKRPTSRRPAIILIIVILAIVGVIAFMREQEYARSVESARVPAEVDLKLFCEFSTRLGETRCREYAHQTLRQDRQRVIDTAFCGGLYSPISDQVSYASCIIRRNIPLP